MPHTPPDEYIPGEAKALAAEAPVRVSVLDPPEDDEDEAFSITRPPSQRRLWEAAQCLLTDETGKEVTFGSLMPSWPEGLAPSQRDASLTPRTIVLFIRHFWCGSCQDYMLHSVAKLDPEVLEKHNVKVVVIACGGWKTIKSYRSLFKCPFPMYADSPRKLYTLMGMIRPLPLGGDPSQVMPYNQGGIAHATWQGISSGLTRLHQSYPGYWKQLGGEFVFSPKYQCDFAHRMTYGTNHMEAVDVLKYAGLDEDARRAAVHGQEPATATDTSTTAVPTECAIDVAEPVEPPDADKNDLDRRFAEEMARDKKRDEELERGVSAA